DDGLRAWFGANLAEVNRDLADERPSGSAARALAYKRVLSLILAARRPSYYLAEDRAALEEFTNSYLRIMADAGVIAPGLAAGAPRPRPRLPGEEPAGDRLHRAQGRQPDAGAARWPPRRRGPLRPRPTRPPRPEHAGRASPGGGDARPALAARSGEGAGAG